MQTEDFRSAAHEIVDWIADYLENPRDLPVLPDMQPGDLVSRLPGSAPEQGEPMGRILEDFHKLIVPAVTHWNHPRFMAYFPSSASPPGVLGEMLSAALNTNAIVWKSSPANTELEMVTMGWLRQWLGLPEEFFGIIYDTASVGTMHAIAAAREMADPEARNKGATRGLTLYASQQAHSSVEKGAIAVGVGRENVRKIPADAEFRMRVDALVEAIETDRKAGLKPFCVVATVGTTSSTSVDPVAEIVQVAEKYGLWCHVDAAYAGAAAILPECRWILQGAERAHSLVVNPHKWLLTPADLSAFFTRRPDILRRAFTLVPEYLRTSQDGKATNFMDYSIAMGRRFRSLKLWFVMRSYGKEGVAEILRRHIGMGQRIAAAVDADQRFERVSPTPFSVVCFRYKGSDEENRALLDRVNATGKTFLSHTELNGRFVIRFAIGNVGTTQQDVDEIWSLIQQLAP
ncbi:MAG: amino acid decarboxylase [Acidobacteriales bacterium]|nr:MAG: amino acid decarboxylase [Terriglobales bacterium]